MPTVAHLSDFHATTLAGATVRELVTKRFFGWLSWRRKRRFVHRREVLDRLIEDVRARAPDTVVVTGDLTNVALPREFEEAGASLRSLGAPDRVFVIPGNHDAYVPVHASLGWDHWASYMRSDEVAAASPEASAAANSPLRAPSFDEFPTLRVRDGVALIGLCSALPTGLFRASGHLGATQIERLEALLRECGQRGQARVVLVHHPVCAGVVSRRRALSDAHALRAVIRSAGAELVLHGHTHRAIHDSIEGRDGPVPVVGVRSSSDSTDRPERRAGYHWFRIEPAAGLRRAHVELEVRGLTSEGEVRCIERRVLTAGG